LNIQSDQEQDKTDIVKAQGSKGGGNSIQNLEEQQVQELDKETQERDEEIQELDTEVKDSTTEVKDPNTEIETVVQSELVDPNAPLPLKQVAKLGLIFCILWFIANYSYVISLQHTSVSSNTIISTTSGFFTLFIGVFFKIEEFTVGKLAAVGSCVGGVALVSLSDEQNSGTDSLVGDLIALFSAAGYGLYIVMLKKNIKSEKQVSMPVFFGFVGLFNTLLLWPILVILHYTGVEQFSLPSMPVFREMLLNGLMGTVLSDLLWSLVVLLTSPLVATLGLSFTVPVAMIVEAMLKKRNFVPQYVGGTALVLLGFVLVNVSNSAKERALFLWIKRKLCRSG